MVLLAGQRLIEDSGDRGGSYVTALSPSTVPRSMSLASRASLGTRGHDGESASGGNCSIRGGTRQDGKRPRRRSAVRCSRVSLCETCSVPLRPVPSSGLRFSACRYRRACVCKRDSAYVKNRRDETQ